MTSTSASTERRDRELRDLIERVDATAEAAVTLAWDKGYRAGEQNARTPLARRTAAVLMAHPADRGEAGVR